MNLRYALQRGDVREVLTVVAELWLRAPTAVQIRAGQIEAELPEELTPPTAPTLRDVLSEVEVTPLRSTQPKELLWDIFRFAEGKDLFPFAVFVGDEKTARTLGVLRGSPFLFRLPVLLSSTLAAAEFMILFGPTWHGPLRKTGGILHGRLDDD